MVQIEITSRCNLSCRTCLKHACEDRWLSRDFDPKLFTRLLPQLHNAAGIHLQGWGEPLLVEQLEEYIGLAKKVGLVVSFTTNGTTMTPLRAETLITSGVDAVTFSMAGARATTHDHLRGKGSFESSWQSLGTLQQGKEKLRSATPKIAVSYLLTPETVIQLPEAVKLARKAGVDFFSTVHLTLAGSPEQEILQLLCSDSKKSRHLKKMRQHANWAALFGKMKLDLKPFTPSPTPVCDKNPIKNFFIGADGSVSPCVFLQPPIAGGIPWITPNGVKLLPRLSFGSLEEKDLADIWNAKEYRDFRKIFQDRLEIYTKAMAQVGFGMDGPEQFEHALKVIRRGFRKFPPPTVCSYCLKMDGF